MSYLTRAVETLKKTDLAERKIALSRSQSRSDWSVISTCSVSNCNSEQVGQEKIWKSNGSAASQNPPGDTYTPVWWCKIRSRASVRVIFSCWAHNVVKWNINHWAQSVASSLLACFQFVWVFQTLQAKIRLGSASRLIRTQADSQHPPLKCISIDHSSWKSRCKCTKALCTDKKFKCSNHPERKACICFYCSPESLQNQRW